MIYQAINNLKKRLIGRLGNSLSSKKGQTAVILILMIAISLVIYSASLNWSRLAQYKTLTTVGSNTAAANMAAMLASYGEQQLQTTMGGKLTICKRTNLIVLIVTAIIAIIVSYICYGSCAAAVGGAWVAAFAVSVVAAVLAVAAVIINVTVVEPGLTRLWNKYQQEMSLDGQIIEGAVLAGLQSAVSDSVTISDHFDMDTDGQWVNDTDASNIAARKDKTSRFGYYYTRRLQSFQRINLIAIEDFVTALTELLYDNPYGKIGPVLGCSGITCLVPDNFGIFDPVCAGTSPKPYCDPCCLPQFEPDGFTPLRPETCTPAEVAACAVAGDYPLAPYAWQYDPYRENFTNAFLSFREQLGIDDENPKYNRNATNPNTPPPQTLAVAPDNVFRAKDSTGYWTAVRQAAVPIIGGTPDQRDGVFPFFWEMSTLLPVQSLILTPPPPVPLIPKSDSVIMMTANPATCTILTCPNNFVAPNDQCAISLAYDAGTNRPKTDGFYWKPGSDQYCSDVYPYDDCITYVGNCADSAFTGGAPTCGCATSGDPTIWHDDYQDTLVFELKEFIQWAQDFLKSDLNQLNVNFTTWYPRAAFWIAPKCSVAADCTNPASVNPECKYCNNEDNDGMLLFWRDTLGIWLDLMDTWIYKTSFSDDTNYCLPTAATAATALLPIEKSAIPSLQVPPPPIPIDRNGVNMPAIWGDLNDTVACLNFNSTNVAKLTSCQTTCLVNPTNYTANADACLNLPRSVVKCGALSSCPFGNNSAVTAENTAYNTAQQLQSCLSSTCQDSFGVTLPVCTGLPVAPPPDCTAWGPGNPYYDAIKTERDNQFDLSNYCEPGGATPTAFQSDIAIALAAATAQEPLLVARGAKLTTLRNEAVAARNSFLSGYVNLNAFLKPCAVGLPLGQGCGNCSAGGPAAQLICAKLNYSPTAQGTGLANFVIYGWQSKAVSGRGPAGTDPDKGYWHLLRVEAFAPKRCYGQCGTSKLPWVKTWTSGGFFNRKRCYGLVETDGTTIARVTRYDEDHDSPGAKFANSQLLWKFRFTNPGVVSSWVPGNVLSTDCRHPITYDQGVSPATVIALDGAFMLNNNPVKDPSVSPVCWDLVNRLLDRGVQTTTCARYYYDASINHMSLKFTICNQGRVDNAIGCAASGLCAEE